MFILDIAYTVICVLLILTVMFFSSKSGSSGISTFASSILDPVVGASNTIPLSRIIVGVLFFILFSISILNIRSYKHELALADYKQTVLESLKEDQNTKTLNNPQDKDLAKKQDDNITSTPKVESPSTDSTNDYKKTSTQPEKG